MIYKNFKLSQLPNISTFIFTFFFSLLFVLFSLFSFSSPISALTCLDGFAEIKDINGTIVDCKQIEPGFSCPIGSRDLIDPITGKVTGCIPNEKTCDPHQLPLLNADGNVITCTNMCDPSLIYDSNTNSCQPTIPRGGNPSQGSGGMPIPKTPGSLGVIQGVGGFLPIDLSIGSIGKMFETFFSNLLGVFTIVAGLMFLIYFVFGALGWITAGGDPEKVKKAQKQLTNAVLGLVLVVIAYSIVTIIGQVLGLNILNPAGEIENLGPNSNP